jgi:hypothetical protein
MLANYVFNFHTANTKETEEKEGKIGEKSKE